jgi:hypothetical protein
MPAPRARRLVAAVLYLLYLAAFVLLVAYFFFWRPFVAQLRQAPVRSLTPPQHVDAATMRRLGSLRADRSSSFANFSPAKIAGAVRVCALGDSFTYGDEAADGHDYPALLRDLFIERGASNVEVLNFGNPWYGFHQAFIVWNDIARRFRCDVNLLGPDCFQADRDTTFNHTNLAQPYYLHARYVLDGDDVRLVEVGGETPEERFDHYFGFVPGWRYLRYDRNPPALLQAIVGFGRTVANPFYYMESLPQAEAAATYEVLLRRLAAEDVQVVLLHTLPEIVDIGRRIGSPQLVAAQLARGESYPYYAPGGHYSSFGNRLVAQHYYARLTGEAAVDVVEFRDIAAEPVSPRPESERLPLSAFDRIELRIANQPAGLLAVAARDPALRVGAVDALSGSETAALLGLYAPTASVVDAGFIPLKQATSLQEDVVVRVQCGNESREQNLGAPRWIDGRINVASLQVAGLTFEGGGFAYQGDWPDQHTACDDLRVTLSLGSTPVLTRARPGWPMLLDPADGTLWNFRVGEGQYVAAKDFGASGVVTLALNRPTPGLLQVPLAEWRRQSMAIAPLDVPPAKRLGLVSGKMTVSATP